MYGARLNERIIWSTLGASWLAFSALACKSTPATGEENDSDGTEIAATESSDGDETTDDSDTNEESDGEETVPSSSDDLDAGGDEPDDAETDEGFVEEPTEVVGDAGGEACGVSPFGATRVSANVLIVLDKSSSMTDVPESFDEDKWTAVKTAVSNALQSVQDDVSFGLHLYPYPDGCNMPGDGSISVGVGVGTDTVPLIIETLDDTEPSGGTPTALALAQALEYFTEGPGQSLDGRKYVLLATDGGPACNEELSCEADECVANLEGRCPEGFTNCCDPEEGGPGAERNCLDDDETLVQVEALQAADIDTFVVGIPGSEIFSDSLDAFALAGGQSLTDAATNYFAVGDTEALTEVLSSITENLLTTCQLQLESEPPDLEQLNVEVDGEFIPQEGDDGWELDTSTEPPTVILQGATCERIETEGAESIRVVYGCPTFRPRVR